VTLGLHLVRFPEVLEEMLVEMLPNRLTDYLFELSQKFTTFYSDCQVPPLLHSTGTGGGGARHVMGCLGW